MIQCGGSRVRRVAGPGLRPLVLQLLRVQAAFVVRRRLLLNAHVLGFPVVCTKSIKSIYFICAENIVYMCQQMVAIWKKVAEFYQRNLCGAEKRQRFRSE